MLKKGSTFNAAELYLGDADPRSPLASPLFADPAGLPPLLIQVGSEEVLLSNSTLFAEKARLAGVDVTLEIWKGMQHVWQYAASMLPEARQAVARIGEYITQHARYNELRIINYIERKLFHEKNRPQLLDRFSLY